LVFLALQANAWNAPEIKPIPLPLKSVPIHYSALLSFEAIELV
jgi:hypothetical protein